MKNYGDLEFGTGGRLQIARALDYAEGLAQEHSAPFLMGLGRKNLEITVAPISERSMLIDPLSAIATGSGFWSVSDMHSHRFLRPQYVVGTPEDTEMFKGGDKSGVVFTLYDGCGYGAKPCGGFVAGDRRSVLVLERAVEDAAKMAHAFGKARGHVALAAGGGIAACHRLESGNGTIPQSLPILGAVQDFLEVRPRDVLGGELQSPSTPPPPPPPPPPPLLRDKVSNIAEAAYEKFSQAA